MMPYQLTCVQYCIHQLTTLCNWSEPTARAACWQNWTSRRRIEQCSSDQRLLGVFWQNNIYIYKALPFGLRSSPKKISALTADAMMWVLNDRGVSAAIVPPELQELVFNRALRWTLQSWTRLLSFSWLTALRLPLAQPTSQLSEDI